MMITRMVLGSRQQAEQQAEQVSPSDATTTDQSTTDYIVARNL